MSAFKLMILVLSLAACTSIGEERIRPPLPATIVEHNTYWETNAACWSLAPWWHKLVLPWYFGCTKIKKNKCTVYVTRGHEDALHHEIAHCQGYGHN